MSAEPRTREVLQMAVDWYYMPMQDYRRKYPEQAEAATTAFFGGEPPWLPLAEAAMAKTEAKTTFPLYEAAKKVVDAWEVLGEPSSRGDKEHADFSMAVNELVQAMAKTSPAVPCPRLHLDDEEAVREALLVLGYEKADAWYRAEHIASVGRIAQERQDDADLPRDANGEWETKNERSVEWSEEQMAYLRKRRAEANERGLPAHSERQGESHEQTVSDHRGRSSRTGATMPGDCQGDIPNANTAEDQV